jgi:hypothetical protein
MQLSRKYVTLSIYKRWTETELRSGNLTTIVACYFRRSRIADSRTFPPTLSTSSNSLAVVTSVADQTS